MQVKNRNSYYYSINNAFVSFATNKGSTFLFYGPPNPDLLKILSFKKAVLVIRETYKSFQTETRKAEEILVNSYEDFVPREKYDYILLNGALGKTGDLMRLLRNVRKGCRADTRIIIYQHNHLWQGLLNLAERIKLKRQEGVHNWLSITDIKSYLQVSGFEMTRVYRCTLIPYPFLGIGDLINFVFRLIPFLDFLKLDQYILAHADFSSWRLRPEKSLTICITVKNERGNIEPIVKSIPKITNQQEILFVEGHSTDGTRREILRVAREYDKGIRVITQPGEGQGDAIRVGFKQAKGDVVVLHEGDQTSDPRDIEYFYLAVSSGRFDFVEGSRFVYNLDNKKMPFLKKIGNMILAKWFTYFLGQQVTDVLSGIKAIDKRSFEKIYKTWGNLGVTDPFGDFELLFGAVRHGLKIGEIPMRYYSRVYGESKTGLLDHGPVLIKMAFLGYWFFRSK